MGGEGDEQGLMFGASGEFGIDVSMQESGFLESMESPIEEASV
jgi:hypothetical protein